jgi:hypothetical protein
MEYITEISIVVELTEASFTLFLTGYLKYKHPEFIYLIYIIPLENTSKLEHFNFKSISGPPRSPHNINDTMINLESQEFILDPFQQSSLSTVLFQSL